MHVIEKNDSGVRVACKQSEILKADDVRLKKLTSANNPPEGPPATQGPGEDVRWTVIAEEMARIDAESRATHSTPAAQPVLQPVVRP